MLADTFVMQLRPIGACSTCVFRMALLLSVQLEVVLSCSLRLAAVLQLVTCACFWFKHRCAVRAAGVSAYVLFRFTRLVGS